MGSPIENRPQQNTPSEINPSERAKQLLIASAIISKKLNHDHVGTGHLLVALTLLEPNMFLKVGVDLDKIRSSATRLEGHSQRYEEPNDDDVPITDKETIKVTPRLERAAGTAFNVAKFTNSPELTGEHVLAALVFDEEGIPFHVLEESGFIANSPGITLSKKLYKKLYDILEAIESIKEIPFFRSLFESAEAISRGIKSKESATIMLGVALLEHVNAVKLAQDKQDAPQPQA